MKITSCHSFPRPSPHCRRRSRIRVSCHQCLLVQKKGTDCCSLAAARFLVSEWRVLSFQVRPLVGLCFPVLEKFPLFIYLFLCVRVVRSGKGGREWSYDVATGPLFACVCVFVFVCVLLFSLFVLSSGTRRTTRRLKDATRRDEASFFFSPPPREPSGETAE